MKKVLVTGGAGFIGSHVADECLRRGFHVTVYDNLSTGYRRNLKTITEHNHGLFVEGDLLDKKKLETTLNGIDVVFHLAANADLRDGINAPQRDLEQNLLSTINVLDGMRKHGIKQIMFTSSAAVYGEPIVFPTPENYAPFQTSTYGAAKMSSEAFIQAYAEYYGIQAWIYRFVSLMGERYAHGVALDFFQQLRQHPNYLQFMANGSQKKSYLDVQDAIDGIFLSMGKAQAKINIFNLGHDETVTVKSVADAICSEQKLTNVEYRYKEGSRGWIGDSPMVLLDTRKLKALGWKPKTSLEEVIQKTIRYLQSCDPNELRSY